VPMSPRLANLLTGLVVVLALAFLVSDFVANSPRHAIAIRRKATIFGGACFAGLVVNAIQDREMLEILMPRIIVSVASAIVAAAARRLFSRT